MYKFFSHLFSFPRLLFLLLLHLLLLFCTVFIIRIFSLLCELKCSNDFSFFSVFFTNFFLFLIHLHLSFFLCFAVFSFLRNSSLAFYFLPFFNLNSQKLVVRIKITSEITNDCCAFCSYYCAIVIVAVAVVIIVDRRE